MGNANRYNGTPHAAAESIAKQIRKHFGLEMTKELIVRDNLVIWESGPFEWAIELPYAVHCEYIGPALEERGLDPTYKGGWEYTVPPGFNAEPQNGYTLGVYKD